MSKERLEEIKTWLNRGFDLTEEDIDWLIKQAENKGISIRIGGFKKWIVKH